MRHDIKLASSIVGIAMISMIGMGSVAHAACAGNKLWVTKKWSSSAENIPDKMTQSIANEVAVKAPDNPYESCIAASATDWTQFKNPFSGIDVMAILNRLMQNVIDQACGAVRNITAMPAQIQGQVVNQFNGATQGIIDNAAASFDGTVNNSLSGITNGLTGGINNAVGNATGGTGRTINNIAIPANGAVNGGQGILKGILP